MRSKPVICLRAPPYFTVPLANYDFVLTKYDKPLFILLLNRDAFRQIARLIHIGAFEYGHMIRKQLQGNGVDDW